jgi:hypothetical protein
MENKYFTPDIDDIHIGYELEVNYNFKLNDIFHKKIIDSFEELSDIHSRMPGDCVIRIPYLTKEQIEAEGWKFDYNLGDFDYYIKKVNDKEEYELEFCYKERININIWKRTLYHGECKDINTFRKLIKLLGI